MKHMLRMTLLALTLLSAWGQNTIAWKATTGDVSLSGAGTTATVQKTATNTVLVTIDKITVYCSVACNVTQAANGTAATTTAGTITPVLPDSPSGLLPFNFYTASNVGTGTDQGGIIHIPAGQTVTVCLSTSCGNGQNVVLGAALGGVGTNYSVLVSSITGTANITFFGRVSS